MNCALMHALFPFSIEILNFFTSEYEHLHIMDVNPVLCFSQHVIYHLPFFCLISKDNTIYAHLFFQSTSSRYYSKYTKTQEMDNL